MIVDELAERVVSHFEATAGDHGLSAGAIRADYRLNWGGFVCASFTVTDGARTFHVKLAPDEHHQRGLHRWARVHDLLSDRYHAPRMLGRIALDGWAGLLFEHVDGESGDWRDTAMLDRVAPVIHRLHADAELAARIAGPERRLRDSFDGYFLEICRSDLEEMPRMPPFVEPATAPWMRAEVERLAERVHASAAFDGPSAFPCHGDLWPGNVLVRSDGSFALIDWDELAPGDPALDWGLLLYSPVDAGADPSRWLGDRIADPAFMERLSLCIRGTHLLNIVDSLADWWDATRAPAHTDRMRAEKEAVHRWALARYRELYGT